MTDGSNKNACVLIVDDEPMVRELVDITLRRAGYHTVMAASGEEALIKLDGAECNLALLDLHLPGMDGVQLCGEIARQHPQVSRVALTGYPAEYSPEELRLRGFQRFLTKPIHLRTLIDTVAELLGDKNAS